MPEPTRTEPRIALAFDYGRRRIGMAAGDTLTATAAPRGAIDAQDGIPDWIAITREIRALSPHVLVVGVPYNGDGSDSSLAQAARDFGSALQARFALPVEHVDEHGSSMEAGGGSPSGRTKDCERSSRCTSTLRSRPARVSRWRRCPFSRSCWVIVRVVTVVSVTSSGPLLRPASASG